MKVGIRKVNITNRIKARTTGKINRKLKRSVNPLYGKKGMGLITDPEKSIYNRVYRKTSVSVDTVTEKLLNDPYIRTENTDTIVPLEVTDTVKEFSEMTEEEQDQLLFSKAELKLIEKYPKEKIMKFHKIYKILIPIYFILSIFLCFAFLPIGIIFFLLSFALINIEKSYKKILKLKY